jgi:hypothetical protein
VLDTMGFGCAMERSSTSATGWRVYLRDPADLEQVRDLFYSDLGEEVADRTLFLEADICRRALKLEIEGVFVG